jgi:hypothetical protein
MAHDNRMQTASSLSSKTVKHARSRLASLDRKQVRVALLAVNLKPVYSPRCLLCQTLVMLGFNLYCIWAYNTFSAAKSFWVIDMKHTLQVLIADRLEASSRREQMCHQQLESQAVSLSGRQVGCHLFLQAFVIDGSPSMQCLSQNTACTRALP